MHCSHQSRAGEDAMATAIFNFSKTSLKVVLLKPQKLPREHKQILRAKKTNEEKKHRNTILAGLSPDFLGDFVFICFFSPQKKGMTLQKKHTEICMFMFPDYC